MPPHSTLDRHLLEDGRLLLCCDAALHPLIERWLPRLPAEAAACAGGRATIDVRILPPKAEERGPGEAVAAPTLRVGSAAARVDGAGATVILSGAHPGVRGTVDLVGLSARLGAPPPSSQDTAGAADIAGDLYSMLTIAAALLLGRIGRTPVHAGAVVLPGGDALLLAGDARAGKSTTTLNLIRAGWDYLSDDQVVLSPAPAGEGVVAEGWPRDFHLDVGWEAGTPTGRRQAIDPGRFGAGAGAAGRWRRRAGVAGLLFPVVRPAEPTRLRPLTAADALGRLLRQTPWLLADPVPARQLLALLTEVAGRPAFELSLGLDTYRDGARLARILVDRGP